MKINNLLVARPKKLYKLNSFDINQSSGYYNSPGVMSPMSNNSDSIASYPFTCTNNNYTNTQTSLNKTSDCSALIGNQISS